MLSKVNEVGSELSNGAMALPAFRFTGIRSYNVSLSKNEQQGDLPWALLALRLHLLKQLFNKCRNVATNSRVGCGDGWK